MKNIFCILFKLILVLLQLSRVNKTENEYQYIEKLEYNYMLFYDVEEDNKQLKNVLPMNADMVYCYETEGIDVVMYTDEMSSITYVIINGQKLEFTDEFVYVLRESSPPMICITDINNDGTDDIMLSDFCGENGGMVNNVYVSSAEGGSFGIGNAACKNSGTNESERWFKLDVSLEDDYCVLLEVDEYDLCEIVNMDERFIKTANLLGLYDENGKLTQYGRQWHPQYQELYTVNIEYYREDGKIKIAQTMPVAVGYSRYKLCNGVKAEWSIQDNGYKLENVEILLDK